MATHITATALLGATLLLGGATSCRQEAAPVGTGSYQLNGRTITCQATASLYTSAKASDALYVELTTTPEPAGGSEKLSLVFRKIKGRPDTDYTHEDAYYLRNGQSQLQGVRYVSPQATSAPTASGGFSGAFTVSPGYGATDSIRAGVFTEARVK